MPSVWAFSPLSYWWPFLKNMKIEGSCSGITGITWSVQPEFLKKCFFWGGIGTVESNLKVLPCLKGWVSEGFDAPSVLRAERSTATAKARMSLTLPSSAMEQRQPQQWCWAPSSYLQCKRGGRSQSKHRIVGFSKCCQRSNVRSGLPVAHRLWSIFHLCWSR